MRICFLLSTVGHPRHRKRIRSLVRLGVDARVLAFVRPDHLEDPETPELISLGEVRHEDLMGRIGVYARAVARIRRAARDCDAVYCFGPDLLGLARLAVAGMRPSPRLALEVGDLSAGLVRRDSIGRAARAAERALLRGDVLVVATSPAFVTKYYEGMQGRVGAPSLVIENKIDPQVTPLPLPPRVADGVLRVGWFGLLKCERSWEALKAIAARADGAIEVVLRGRVYERLASLPEEAAALPSMRWDGVFVEPDDLQAMYAGVDLCWMVHHDPDRPYENWGWARSNRLYQAGWFGTPLIGQFNKDDTTVVRDHDIGVEVDVLDVAATVEVVTGITQADVARWRERLEALPRSLFALSDEHARLLAMLAPSTPP